MTGFFDRVRVRSSSETDRLGLSGREGQVHGWTTPSSTGVEVIGAAKEDSAVNVFFEELDDSFWFADDLLEFVDHASGTTISFDGVDAEWVRQDDGSWAERPKSK